MHRLLSPTKSIRLMSEIKVRAYMDMAKAISQLSPDEQTQVGAVLISNSGRQIASGYNGFLRNANDSLLPTRRPLKYQYMQHAERNILYNCLDEGISTKNCTIITTLSPCLECIRACYQSGIKTIIYDRLYFDSEDIYKDLLDLKISIDKLPNGYTVLEFLNDEYDGVAWGTKNDI